jgi:hypothetical protein
MFFFDGSRVETQASTRQVISVRGTLITYFDPSPCFLTGAASHLELSARAWALLIDAAETSGIDDSLKSGTDFRAPGIQLRPQPRQEFRRFSALLLEDHRQSGECQSSRLSVVQCYVGFTAVRRRAASATGLAIKFSNHD